VKRALTITLSLCVLISCLDLALTWQNTVESSEGPFESFTTIGVRHGAFVNISGDRRYSSFASGLTASLHIPQVSPLFRHGGWWGIGGAGISVLVAVPILVAAFVGVRATFRRLRRSKPSQIEFPQNA